jgi:hypothetical protein
MNRPSGHGATLGAKMFDHHEESAGCMSASIAEAFEALDDHARLSSHMSRPSWRMAWATMNLTVDAGGGRRAGSHIVLSGDVLGIPLYVDEIVTISEPPRRKAWETVGAPQLLVIGSYRMGYELEPDPVGSRLRVFIDYDLPERGASRLLGRLFGRSYARWCTRRMVTDAVNWAAGRVAAAA